MRLLAVSRDAPLGFGDRATEAVRARMDVVDLPDRDPSRGRGRTDLVGRAVLGAIRAPSTARRLWRAASVAGGMKSLVRSLSLDAGAVEAVYFPRPESALGYEPLAVALPSVVGVSAGLGRRLGASRRAVLDHATIVLTPFDSDRRELEAGGISAERIHVARVGFDPDAVGSVRHRGEGDHPRLVCFQIMDWRSALEDLLVAIRRIRNRRLPVSLQLFGAGAERNRVLHAVNDLDLAGVVTLRGRVGAAELERELRGATALVHLDVLGAVDWSVLVAMRAGLPVLATEAGSMPEVVRDGAEGFLVRYGDVDRLASCLAALASDPRGADGMGKRSATRVAELFAPEVQAAGLEQAVEIARERFQRALPAPVVAES